MKVALINPTIGRINAEKSKRKWVLEPLSLAALAGVTSRDVQLSLYDDRIEEIDYDANLDLVGISVETNTALRSYEIARKFRSRGVPVVLGGFHPTLMPEEAKQHADSIVLGQAEEVWSEVLGDFARGKLKPEYFGSPAGFLRGLRPNKDIFRGKSYLPVSLVEAGRGCVYNCDFCAIRKFFNDEYYPRPIESIVEEIRTSKNKTFLIVDDNLASKKSHLEKLCESITPLGINWAGQASISICDDEKMLDLVKKSGCQGLLIGFESLEDDNLKQMGKSANLRKDYSKAISKLRSRGIRVYGSFVIGYDSDTPESVRNTLDFAISEKLIFSNLYPLTPLPNTPLYNRLKEEGRLINPTWWLDYNHQYGSLVFTPKNFTPEGLKSLCDKVRREFYSRKSIFLRSLDFKANSNGLASLAFYYAANYLSRREILAKEKTFLGLEHGTI